MFSRAPDSAARGFIYSAVLWLLVGTSALLLVGLKLVSPESLETPALTFGRMRGVASLALVYGWLTQLALAAALFIVPRVTGARLVSETAAQLSGMLINTGLAFGVVLTMLTGVSGREFMELPVWLAVVFILALLQVALVVLATLLKKQEERLFTSVYYFVGALIAAPVAILVGSLLTFGGMIDEVAYLFGVQTYLVVFLGGAMVGTLFYVVPRVTQNPLWSHGLGLGGFWALALFGPLSASSLRMFGPSPDWLESLGVSAAIGLLGVHLVVAVNIFATLHGAWQISSERPSIKFAVGGLVVAAGAGMMGLLQAFRSSARFVAATEWVPGTVLLFGVAASLVGFAFITFSLPRLIGRKWFSRPAVTGHFWLMSAAAGLMAIGTMGAGAATGILTRAGARLSTPLSSGAGFGEVLSATSAFHFATFVGFVILAVAQWIFALNLLRSTTLGETRPIEMVVPNWESP